jgi:hypothetical protein
MSMEDAGKTEGDVFTLPGQIWAIRADNGSGTDGRVLTSINN